MKSSRTIADALLLAAAMAAGCGDSPRPMDVPDAPDAAPDVIEENTEDAMDSGDADADVTVESPCDSLTEVVGEEGTVSVTIDTTNAPLGALDLGVNCGGSDFPAPQVAIAYTVPGEGPHAIDVSSINDGTDLSWDPLFQRREVCAAVPTELYPDPCVVDTPLEGGATDLRPSFTVTANGGETMFVVVTGLGGFEGAMDRGVVQVDFTATPSHVPVLFSAELTAVATTWTLGVTGADEDGDVIRAFVTLFDSLGAMIDLNLSGTLGPEDAFIVTLNEDLSGMTSFTASGGFGLAYFARVLDVRSARVELVDAVNGLSDAAEVTATLTGSEGEPCGPADECGANLECTASLCVAASDVETACAAAEIVEIETPSTSTTTATVSTEIASGDGIAVAYCRTGTTDGREALYEVEVPEGAYDLIARTDVSETDADADTVVYIRADCGDPVSGEGTACNDDATYGLDVRSYALWSDVPPGAYTVFVEIRYGVSGDPVPVTTEIALRPVLASESACDDAEILNRCAGERCAGGVCP